MNRYNDIIAVILMVIMAIMVGCSSIETPEFSNAPIPYIAQPTYGKTFQPDEAVDFVGSGCELGDTAVWTSDIDGELSVDSHFGTNLSPGRHTITYTISRGDMEESTDISIRVQKPLNRVRVAATKESKEVRKIVAPDGGVFVVDYNRRTISDMSTGLMWSRYALDYKHSHKEAQVEAAHSTLGGYTNWRVPTLKEFKDVGNIKYDGRSALMCTEFNLGIGAYWTADKPSYKIGSTMSSDVVELKPSGSGLSFYADTGIMNINTLARVLIVRRM